jgi:uncharacterized protein (TIGR02996 family)
VRPEEPFLQAILANPQDEAPWLIFADWLAERGDASAEPFRAHPELRKVIAGLRTARAVPTDLIEEHTSAGHFDFLRTLVAGLELFRGTLTNVKWPGIIDGTLDHLERALATHPGLASADASLARTRSDAQSRPLASMLAASQPAEVLQALFEWHGDAERHAELLACLAQEMVLRGVPPKDEYWDRLKGSAHPLAPLPPRLLPIEVGFADYLPRYGSSGSSAELPLVLLREPEQLPQGAEPPGGLPAMLDRTDETFVRGAVSAVRNWRGESNGKAEARLFGVGRPVQDGQLSVAFLLSLQLACLTGTSQDAVRAERLRPGEAMNHLFAAASNGGAYGGGLLGAYGRLAAWASAQALTGASPGQSIEQVAALAEQCLWHSFGADPGWFYNVAWDLGLIAVRPDRRSLAVLAATDTD